ncbi:phosphonate C-P lyase system protein PhnG [Paracoccus gahaiensis]|uniref:Phosphonate C-P lyase system protein PhnG n=1 Tax=Paracoccus gahaiensis TaxID=1706839 RepID=A0A4U0R9G6_9RHOB|nr:phosphonate C-P lyase system protein PhnG [Paracoccus gahaiensis]TJZ91627.1 phosphonate C-P lyase system protein PhnG [Paracoccus gahaiensis]
MSAPPDPRRDWLSLMARSAPERLAEVLPDLPAHALLRAPETGTVMVQGRVSATGAPFNLGEMTVTRCAIRLDCGTVGHGHVQGRSHAHARRAAVVDALMQTDEAPRLTPLLEGLRTTAQAARDLRAAKAAATRVEFFTLQRGEDA